MNIEEIEKTLKSYIWDAQEDGYDTVEMPVDTAVEIELALIRIQAERDKYREAYIEKLHYEKYGCEYLTIVDGKCVSCNKDVIDDIAQSALKGD